MINILGSLRAAHFLLQGNDGCLGIFAVAEDDCGLTTIFAKSKITAKIFGIKQSKSFHWGKIVEKLRFWEGAELIESIASMDEIKGMMCPDDAYRVLLGVCVPARAYSETSKIRSEIYEYIQVNLTYSSNRMASNRLTRNEVEEVYRTNKITTSFEPVKVDDIIETINHFAAVRYIVDNISAPLTQTFLKKLHHILTYGTYADRKENLHPGEYRTSTSKIGVKPKEISSKLATIIKNYESGAVNLEKILDFHVRLEKIRPFVDYNGRLGRLVMMKECLLRTPVRWCKHSAGHGALIPALWCTPSAKDGTPMPFPMVHGGRRLWCTVK